MKKQNEQQHKDPIKSNKNIAGKAKVTATSTEAKWKLKSVENLVWIW